MSEISFARFSRFPSEIDRHVVFRVLSKWIGLHRDSDLIAHNVAGESTKFEATFWAWGIFTVGGG